MSRDDRDYAQLGEKLRALVENAADALDAGGHPAGRRVRARMREVDELVALVRGHRLQGRAAGRLTALLELIAEDLGDAAGD
jgi:hypothetical protein